jgi:hypothetical protein
VADETWADFQRHLGEDLRRLRLVLSGVADDAGWRVPGGAGPARILDLACGRCDEATALVEWLGQRLAAEGQAAREVGLVGIDIRAREIAEAQRIHRGPRFEFLVGDAAVASGHRELGQGFPLVFIRHQNYWHGRAVWSAIFLCGLELLAEGGVMVLTSYFDREHLLALEAVRGLGGEVLASRRNPLSRELATPGKSVDRHVAVVGVGTGGSGLWPARQLAGARCGGVGGWCGLEGGTRP